MVGQDGKGLSCYCYQPSKPDGSIEAFVITSYSGFIAENRFRKLAGLPERHPQVLEDSEDWSYPEDSPAISRTRIVQSGLLGVCNLI